jgi:type II secretory pathway pseudopilin PulG
MSNAKFGSRGFTLIASLLLLLLLSGFALALLMMVNTEQRAGGNDLNNNYTYRAAEGAIEKMTSDLAYTFKSIQAPTSADICNLNTNPGPPTWDATVSFTAPGAAYEVAPVNPAVSDPCAAPIPPLPTPVWGPIQSGPEAGLYAQIIPVTLTAAAQRFTGETVAMTRTAEVALIPVFQFGVFSDSDLFYGQSPNLGFAGRVHTNGDIYLGVANGAFLVFGDKIAAFGNVIRQQMDDGLAVGSGLDDGTVLVPTASNGCSVQLAALQAGTTITASSTCVSLANPTTGSVYGLGPTDGSVVGGHGSAQNTSTWVNTSEGTLNSFLIDGNGTPGGTADGSNSTGATDLTLPFVNGTTNAAQIIRRPLTTTLPTSLLGASQLAYEAQIRVLLSDDQAGLHLEDWNGDASGDIQLVSALPKALTGLNQGASSGGSQAGAINVNGSGHYYLFGEAYCAGTAVISSALAAGAPCPTAHGGDSNFVVPPYYGPMAAWPPATPSWAPTTFPTANSTNFSTANQAWTSGSSDGLEWPLIGGWLRVEAKWTSDGVWHPVTAEWLKLGFARGVSVPTSPGFGCGTTPANNLTTNGCNALVDHKNAILYFQVTKDSKLAGAPSVTADYPLTGAGVYYDTSATSTKSQYNWYPINLYDAREGENYDATGLGAGTGTSNGVLNAVELDVGNLRNWLLGNTGTTGTSVNFAAQNGYILYFSDRRGMQFANNCGTATCTSQYGEYGFEDTVNLANVGNKLAPDGKLDPVNYNNVSPEDVNGNTILDNYGVKGVGDAFGYTADTDSTSPPSPYLHRFNLSTIALANRVTGARHALKLVDGSLGNLPTMPPGNSTNNCTQSSTSPTGCGGFTVASENPVYIVGNYNSNCYTVGDASCTPGTTAASLDPMWKSTSTSSSEPNHSAASVIADAVTLLSNNWQDWGCLTVSAICPNTGVNAIQQFAGSLVNPINPDTGTLPNRMAISTYYRVAVAGGKSIAFNNAANNPDAYFGSDGGVHNFLRFLEDWAGSSNANGPQGLQSLYYKGSLVSLYWNMYATGTFKCCTLVYHPPNRQFYFDPLFSQPQNLPPGTPMFRNVDNLSYRQNQVARSN